MVFYRLAYLQKNILNFSSFLRVHFFPRTEIDKIFKISRRILEELVQIRLAYYSIKLSSNGVLKVLWKLNLFFKIPSALHKNDIQISSCLFFFTFGLLFFQIKNCLHFSLVCILDMSLIDRQTALKLYHLNEPFLKN